MEIYWMPVIKETSEVDNKKRIAKQGIKDVKSYE